MRYQGGTDGAGVIFSYDPSISVYTKLKDFDYANGGYPSGSLMQASDGKLYGMTDEGGSNGVGVIFSFNPLTSIYTKLKDFDVVNGVLGTSFIEVNEFNKPPLVRITHPFNHSRHTTPAFLTLSADAKDFDGTIKQIDFYNGPNLIFTETVSPYQRKGYIISAPGTYSLTAKATDNDGNVSISDPVNIVVLPNKPPTVKITHPANGSKHVAPAYLELNADAIDEDGIIKKVEFYNGSNLIFTETDSPYQRIGYQLPIGRYFLTAKATDNVGNVTTSDVVEISVIPSEPIVKMLSPKNNLTYVGPLTMPLVADARDPDGVITKVEFYNGTTLLGKENDPPYNIDWNVGEGNYSITAKATDDKGHTTTSDVVNVSVVSPCSSPVSLEKNVTNIESNARLLSAGSISLRAGPDPAQNILNIYTSGFQQNKKLAISVVSVSGVTIKTIYAKANQTTQMNVSALAPGVYLLKAFSGDQILYSQFVKL